MISLLSCTISLLVGIQGMAMGDFSASEAELTDKVRRPDKNAFGWHSYVNNAVLLFLLL